MPGDAAAALETPPAIAPADAGHDAGLGATPAEPSPQIACVNNTSWVIAARPAQNKDQLVVDDPVAGQALAWLANQAASDAGSPVFHSFAACPGAVPQYQTAAQAPSPGAAQGIIPPALPLEPQPGVQPAETVPSGTVPSPDGSQALPTGGDTGQQGAYPAPRPGGQQD